jgi:hypothetical protein
MSYIVVEIVLVFGGVLAFAWWQFRDLARERRVREASRPGVADADLDAAQDQAKKNVTQA